MTARIPFTAASLARAIKGVQQAGQFVVGVRSSDGMLIIANKPVDTASLVPEDAQPSAEKRMADYFNGGQGEAQRA